MTKARSSFDYLPGLSFSHVLCHSSFGGPWPGMTAEELVQARTLLLEHAQFSSIEILAFSLRPGSFDLLLKVPMRLKLSKKEMLARIESDFNAVSHQSILVDIKSGAPGAMDRLAKNFGSVSFFLKRFKQVLARNYHRMRNSSGVLWKTRFESSYIEPGSASRIVAAWIDHGFTRDNPGIPPEEYPYCTIGWAAAGGKPAREMLRKTFIDAPSATWPATWQAWQNFISSEPLDPKTRTNNIDRTPPLTRAELMLHPVPHFNTGLAVGSYEFIERLFEHNREYFSDGRETGPRFIVGQNDPNLFSMRDKGDLRKPPRSKRQQPTI